MATVPPPPNRAPWGHTGPEVTGLTPLPGDAVAEVAVVGAGITGITAALELAEAGVDVLVLEAGDLGAGATGFTTAKVSVLQGTKHHDIAQKWGDEVTAAFAQANQTGLEWILRRVDALEIACDLERRPAATYATTADGIRQVEGEVEAANRAGLPVRLERDLDVPYPVQAVAVLDDQAQFDPLAYLRGLARAAIDRGARLHTRTRALGLQDGHLVTDKGKVEAEHVLVCTGIPFLDRAFTFARMEPKRSYCLGARVAGELPRTMSISADEPTRSLRTAVAPDGMGELLVVGGSSHVVGREPDTRSRYEALAGWTEEHFDLQAIDWRWSTQDYLPVDNLPLIGRAWGLPGHVQLATGYAKWGMTKGTAAGLALAAGVTGERPAWAEPFDPRRADPLRAPLAFGELNGTVGWRLVRDRLVTLRRKVTGLENGEAAVVHSGVAGRTAVSQVDGQRCAVSGVCPHTGGTLSWNTAEQTWDCPLHGSRFARTGELRQGPAVEDLEPRKDPVSS